MCPFCGGRAVLDEYACGEMNITVEHADGCWLTEYEGVLDVLVTEKSAYVEAWNTRAERTCTAHIGDGDTRGWWVCDSCGDLFDSLSALACKKRKAPNYCPNCGAKVVER